MGNLPTNGFTMPTYTPLPDDMVLRHAAEPRQGRSNLTSGRSGMRKYSDDPRRDKAANGPALASDVAVTAPTNPVVRRRHRCRHSRLKGIELVRDAQALYFATHERLSPNGRYGARLVTSNGRQPVAKVSRHRHGIVRDQSELFGVSGRKFLAALGTNRT